MSARLLVPLLLLVSWCVRAAEPVQAYEKDVALPVGQETLTQHRWYLENEHVRLAVIDDPGGAVVEFVNKATGTNHVAGDVYRREVNGKVEKRTGWGWKEFTADHSYDPTEKQLNWQPYQVAFEAGADGAQSLVVTGQTAEQRMVRRHTLRPGSAELRVDLALTNIAPHARRLWLRWHPYSYAGADRFGDSAVVLTPAVGDQVRKIRIGWGWDHWFSTHEGYWLAADFRTGEGLFMTFEKDKVPIHFTWTSYGRRDERKGAVTLEPFPEVVWAEPGRTLTSSFTYCPITAATVAADVPTGVLASPDEQARARAFLGRVKAPDRLALFGAHTFALSQQFPWQHRRRDLLTIKDWGFVDCAIVGYPLQHKSIQARMVVGLFHDAATLKGFPAGYPQIVFTITATNQDGIEVYKQNQSFLPMIGVPGANVIDREVAIPMQGMPDGTYRLAIEAIDPMTRKPCHRHETEVVVFGEQLQVAAEQFAREVAAQQQERPFVTALAKLDDVQVADGRVRIPIGVEDGSATVRTGYPVCLGVPFPQGALPAASPARLLAPDGTPVAAQFRVMNVWPGGSLKWLQVDFAASCPADGFAFYTLEVGQGVAAPAVAGPDLAVATAQGVELRPGPLLLRLDREQGTIPGELFHDRNGDGQFSADEQVLLAAEAGDAWWQGEAKEGYRFVPRGPAGGMFTPGLTIEQNGPERATVKLQGWYEDAQGHRPAYGEARIEVYRGQRHFRVWHQVTFTGSPWRDRLHGYGLRLRLPPGSITETVYDLDGQAVPIAAAASELYQRLDDRAALTSGGSVRPAQRASGAVLLRGPSPLLIYQAELWQRFPKRIAVDPAAGLLELDYWPRAAGAHSFAPVEEYWIPSSSSAEAAGTGASRTAELVFEVAPATPVERAAAVHGEPVVAATPPAWISATDALGSLSPFDPARYPEVEEYVREVTAAYERHRALYKFYGHWQYGTLHNVFSLPLYRWLEVGRYANIGNEEDIVRGPWLAWFRSGDRRHLRFAKVWTQHLMEVQSIRWHDTWPEYIGMSRRHHYTPWLGSGDWGHTMLCPWLEYYHATGYYPAWEMAVQTAKSMANTYEGGWRYITNPLIGHTRMYLETGDEQYKQVADRIWRDLCAPDRNEWMNASHAGRAVSWYGSLNPECRDLAKTWAREGRVVNNKPQLEFQYLDALHDLWRQTGDDTFAHLARLNFDGFRGGNHFTLGRHPLWRGMVPTITQYVLGNLREAVIGGDAIARSRELFPAQWYGFGPVREVLVHEPRDGAFTLWFSHTDPPPALLAPDGKPVSGTLTPLLGKRPGGGLCFYRLEVPADGQTGLYRLPNPNLSYLGCSLPGVAVRPLDTLRGSGSAPLYVRSAQLGGAATRFLLTGTPATSIELHELNGDCLCSETFLRPDTDAMGIAGRLALPADATLRLEEHNSVRFLTGTAPLLYLHPDGIFDVPPAQ